MRKEKRQNVSHVTPSTAQVQAPFARALQPQTSSIPTHLQTSSRYSNPRIPWPPPLQTLMLISNSSISSTSIPFTSPSETTTGNPTNAGTRTSRPYLATLSARKPLSCQPKTTVALQLPTKTSRAPLPMETLLQPSLLQARSNSPISHKRQGTCQSWYWRGI
jgi:hypothetical protein